MGNVASEKNGEVKVFGDLVGHAMKVTDAVICQHCHRKNWPQHSGHADYIIDWRGPGGPLSLRTESKSTDKGNPDHFSFASYGEHQQTWMKLWEDVTGCWAHCWLWLQMGDQARSAVLKVEGISIPHPDRRQVWLVNFEAWLRIQEKVERIGGIKNLPRHAEAASSRIAVRENCLYADWLLRHWAMEWHGSNTWWPGKRHPIWRLLRTPYYDISTARAFAQNHPQPD